jgi:hypothetical protein
MVKVQFNVEETMKVQKWSKSLLFYFSLSAGWEWVVNAWRRPIYSQERDPVPTLQEVEYSLPLPVWAVVEKSYTHSIRTPVPPASSQSVYRQRYPDPLSKGYQNTLITKRQYISYIGVARQSHQCL